VHDSKTLKNLVDETDEKVYADSAYRSADIEEYLEKNNCESFVHEKGYKNKPLTEEQKASNKQKSKTRVRVEHIFAFMTNAMNNGLDNDLYGKYRGQKRIASSIGLLNLTYNLFRYEQLLRLKIVKPTINSV
jgi:IS5 family transposase